MEQTAPDELSFQPERDAMVAQQIERRGVRDKRVLEAMRRVARHQFVPDAVSHLAHADQALPLARGQTISQPYIVAAMTEAARLSPQSRVLEIGTGSGYQTAVAADLAHHVFSIEVDAPLSQAAQQRLGALGYANITFRTANGYQGWPEESPFDAIIVTAAPPSIPTALKDQLADGGRLIAPVGKTVQQLLRITRSGETFASDVLFDVSFVPMIAP